MDVLEEIEKVHAKLDKILSLVEKDDSEILNSKAIAAELGISIHTLYSPMKKAELINFGMKNLKMTRKDLNDYKRFKMK